MIRVENLFKNWVHWIQSIDFFIHTINPGFFRCYRAYVYNSKYLLCHRVNKLFLVQLHHKFGNEAEDLKMHNSFIHSFINDKRNPQLECVKNI